MTGRTLPLLLVDGLEAPLRVRADARARRMSLRVDRRTGAVVLTLPPGLPLGQARRFAAAHAGWVRAQQAAVPPPQPFADGAVVPYLGADHRICHVPPGTEPSGTELLPAGPLAGGPDGRRPVWRADGLMMVRGHAEHLPRRVHAFLMAEAKRELTGRAAAKARALGRRVAAVAVRDPRSRWGSCSAGGRLSFSWRLILAPEPVLDYVAAHEVAHLAEMNHGPRFWSLVDRLAADRAGARAWLKRHGAALHRYGREAG